MGIHRLTFQKVSKHVWKSGHRSRRVTAQPTSRWYCKQVLQVGGATAEVNNDVLSVEVQAFCVVYKT